jgi:hypothetical protein
MALMIFLFFKVRDANWAITKATAAYRQRGGPQNYISSDIRYVGDLIVLPSFSDGIKIPHINSSNRASSQMVFKSNTAENNSLHISASVDSLSSIGLRKNVSKRLNTPGTYQLCGVTSCGSLRSDGTCDHGNHHGQYASLTDSERELQLLSLSDVNDGIAAVSRVPVREKGLEHSLRRAKIANGYSLEKKQESYISYLGEDHEIQLERERVEGISTTLFKPTSPSIVASSLKERGTLGDFNLRRTEQRHRPHATFIPSSYKPSSYDPHTVQMNLPSPSKSNRKRLGGIEAVDTNDFPELEKTRPPPGGMKGR